MGGQLLVYGSYGYTGSLVVEEAVAEGTAPVLAGRRAEAVEAQAAEYGLDHRTFSLTHPSVVEAQLGDVDAVLNCAGPFEATAGPLVDACLATGTDYLDIAGRVDVLEATAERDRDAEKAGVTLLPAVGFDVVPTDCLAAHLESELPSAERLVLAMDGFDRYSPGTLKSIVDGLARPGLVREDGELRDVPVAWKTRRFDFGAGERPAVTVPWGDLSTAYYSTGIGDIETYATLPGPAAAALRRSRPLVPLIASRPVRQLLKATIDATVTGPSAAQRARGGVRIRGEVADAEGGRVAALMRTPDTYSLTAATAVAAAGGVLDGEVSEGFQTPASAFGADFVADFDGVTREEVALETPVEVAAGS